MFANGAVLDDQYSLREKYNLFTYRIIFQSYIVAMQNIGGGE